MRLAGGHHARRHHCIRCCPAAVPDGRCTVASGVSGACWAQRTWDQRPRAQRAPGATSDHDPPPGRCARTHPSGPADPPRPAARSARGLEMPAGALAWFAPPPAPLTSLVGRERELADLAALVARHDGRLVTLTGPGGSGKTRLALETGRRLLRDFGDGVVFVDLTPLTDAALVLPTIASTLGVREQMGYRLVETLVNVLASKHLLLCSTTVSRCSTQLPKLPNCWWRSPTSRSSPPAGNPYACEANASFQCFRCRCRPRTAPSWSKS